jgi:hypothetical protein
MKTPTVRLKTELLGAEPDLELTTPDMIAVHDWLVMAFDDVCRQVDDLKPSAIQTNATRKRVEVEMVGINFLQNWLNVSIHSIENALTEAGVLPKVDDQHPAENGRLN